MIFTNGRSLQFKILLLFATALIAVALLVTLTTLSSTYRHSNQQLQNQFTTSQEVLIYKLMNDSSAMRESLQSTAKAFSFKQLVAGAEDDPESLSVAMDNYQRRIGADISAIYKGSGELLVGGDDLFETFNPALIENKPLFLKDVIGEVYLVVAVPVKFVETSRRADAWLIMAKNLADLITVETNELTGFEIGLISVDEWVLDTHDNGAFSDLSPLANALPQEMTRIQLAEGEVIAYRFAPVEGSDVSILFWLNTESALVDFNNLRLQLMIEILVAVIIATGLSLYISRDITLPLRTLTAAAMRIRLGDYQEKIPSFNAGEFRELSLAFEGMQSGIKDREQSIESLAYYDQLTKLPNRNAFMKAVADRIEQQSSHSFAIIILNLDRFKEVNDTIGHKSGDFLLQCIARRITSTVVDDTFNAHFGGDEFAILKAYKTESEIQVFIEQVSEFLELPFAVENIRLDVDASFGSAVYPKDASSADELIRCADIALNCAKESHKHLVSYHEALNKYSVQRLNLMSQLRMAIDQNQLQLFYQPKLNLASQKIEDVECLVRWIHPEHGFISPDDFIPLAEQTGAIRDLTDWVIQTALKQAVEWQNQGIVFRFAINISALDLVDLKLPSMVSELLSECKLDTDSLTFEITESAVMADPEQAIRALDMLHRMNIKLSIDDFGTGYSSMAQLKQMPVDELKIDKSFVLDMATNEDDQKIVKSTVDLAHNLGLSVVAEGVENKESLQLLKDYGVEYAQGYFIVKPIPAADMPSWLEEFYATQSSPKVEKIGFE